MNFSKIAKMLLSFSLLCCFCLSANVLTEADFQKAQAMKNGKVYVDQTTKAKTNDIKSLDDIKSVDLDIMQITKNDKEAVNVHPNQAKIDYYNDLKANPSYEGSNEGSRDCADTDNGATDSYGDACSGYTNFPSWCGGYNDDDFDSMAMCCACGGGEEVADPEPEGCDDGETAYSWTCGGGSYQGEVSWTLSDGSAGVAGSGDLCLADGDYTLTGYDNYGDSWNGNLWTLSDADGNLLFTWGLSYDNCYDSGFASNACNTGDASFSLGGAPPVGGCTDPNAPNYDPAAEVDDGTCEEYCAATACGSWFASGYTCEELVGYGYDCSVCEAAGECPAVEPCVVFDCAGTCAEGYESWATDAYCDGVDAPYGYNFDCPEWGCDNGECGNVDLGDGTCGAPADPTCAETACGGYIGSYTCDQLVNNYAFDCDICLAEEACAEQQGTEGCYFDFTPYGAEDCDAAFDAFGATCDVLEANYNWNCAGCECPEPPACTVFDCAGTCAEGYESWATDAYCDGVDAPYGYNFDCPEWGCDNGECGNVDLGDGTCGAPAICEDDTACNTGSEGDCSFPATGYNCDGSLADGWNLDCVGTVFADSYLSWLGDGYCDAEGYGVGYGLDFFCEEYGFDSGDCSAYADCNNTWGGTAVVDECGACGGDGIADGACDCDGNVNDECGVCGGDGIADGACDCDGNVDAGCGCGADGIADGACDCDGNVDAGCGCGVEIATGDLNSDCGLDVLDVIVLVNAVVDGSDIAGGDLNGDDATNVIDVVVLVNLILGSGRTADANTAMINTSDNSVSITADGYIGGVQMTLSHDNGFEINLTDNALVAEYRTEGTSTILVVVAPEGDVLFTTNKSFEIVDMIVANSTDEIEVNTITDFGLSAAYPNPFNPSTTVSLTVPSADYVSVKVYNLMGQVVGVLADGMMEANVYSFTWDASNMSSGVYLVKAESSSSVDIQKVLLVK